VNHRLLSGEAAQLLPMARRVAEILQRGSGVPNAENWQDLVNGSFLPTEGPLK
jgi:hypothetical protein